MFITVPAPLLPKPTIFVQQKGNEWFS
jgi:hypothetical protein